ncbi:nascent polypeptide-associated complex subunit alpha-like protein 1 [Tanacetum coccineum]
MEKIRRFNPPIKCIGNIDYTFTQRAAITQTVSVLIFTELLGQAVSASKSITRQYDDVLPDGDDKSGGKQSRSEKKSHKAMFKLGMKAILGVSRVTIKRTKYISYGDSEVIMKPGTDWVKPSLGWTYSFIPLYWRGGGWDTTYGSWGQNNESGWGTNRTETEAAWDSNKPEKEIEKDWA